MILSEMTPKLNEAELIELIRSKSRFGAELLYDLYANVLLLAIYRLIPEKEAAETILQQTFMEVWNSLEQYLQQKEQLLAWLLRIARRKAQDALNLNLHPLALEIQ